MGRLLDGAAPRGRARWFLNMSNKVEIIGAASDAERAVGAIFAEAFGATSLNVSDDFFELGGDSLLAVGLLLKIEEVFARSLPLDILGERPTIRALAAYLAAPQDAPRDRGVVTIQAGNGHTPLFCLPGVGGNVLDFHLLAKRLRPTQTIYALPTMGANEGETAQDTIPAIAAHVVDRIRSVQPQGPYQLLGYSMGGVVAFEAALQLRAAGDEVGLLAMLDSSLWSPSIELPLAQKLRVHWEIFSHAPPRGKVRYLADRLRVLRARIRRRSFKRREEDFVEGLALSPASRKLADLHTRARRDYEPAVYDRPIVLFRAWRTASLATAVNEADPKLGWAEWTTGDVIVHQVHGAHTAMLHLEELALLDGYLQRPLDQAIAHA